MQKSIKNISKVFLTLLLVIGTIFTSTEIKASSMSNVIHDLVDSEELADGVVYENIKRFTTTGWWNINLVRIDMTNENNELKGLISNKGISNRETVTNLTNQNKALAGINGDFFEYSPIPHSTGGLIQDGEMITSPVESAYGWPAFLLENKGDAKVLLLERTMNSKSLRSGEGVRFQMINKAKSASNMPNASVLYNQHWGEYTPGNKLSKNVIEIVVDNNIVTHIRANEGPVKLNKDRYVIHLRGDFRDQAKNFKLGDEVEIKISSTPNLNNIKFMVSGGSQIIKDGVPTETHLVLKGNQPRTAIGVNKDNTEIVLATIDGRNASFNGVSQKTFGTILKDLGMYNAVNLDGGGSTTMAVKKPGDEKAKLVNKPSDGSQRKVANGVGVVSNAEKGKLTKIKLSTVDTNIIKDSTREIVVTGYDGQMGKVELDRSKLSLTVEGVEGNFNGSTFTPTTGGTGKITAKYDEFETTMDIRVLDKVLSLELPFKDFNIAKNNKKQITPIYGKDGNGYKALIYPRDLVFSVTNDLGEFKDNWFHSKNAEGSGVITVKYGDVSNSVIVSIGTQKTVVDNFGNMDNIKFESYPENLTGSISLNDEVKSGKKSIKLSYEFPKSEGNTAAYVSFKKPLDINTVSKIGLWVKGDGNNSWLRATLTDANGKEYLVDFTKKINFKDWKYLEANIDTNLNVKNLNNIYLVETNKDSEYNGSILLDGLTFTHAPNIKDIVLPEISKDIDVKNTQSEVKDGGYSFIITRAQENLDKITGADALNSIKNRANKHEVGILMGDMPKGFDKGLTNKLVLNSGSPYYTSKKHKNTLFMNINANAGGIRAQSAEQWNAIKSSLKNNSDVDHIVAIVSKPVIRSDAFKDQLEATVLHDIFSEYINAGNNVTIVQNGTQNNVDLREGIRYIEFDGRNVNNDSIKNLKAIEFVINGNEITYQINSIF